jgi:lysophospholipase L1-like esterase
VAWTRNHGQELAPTLRVSPEDYEANLRDMIALCRATGARVLLATAPSAIGAGPAPDFFLALHFIEKEEDLRRLHSQYNHITRTVAREEGAAIADLEAVFAAREVRLLFEDVEKDVIHPNADGYRLLAAELAEPAAALLSEPGN